MQSYHHDSAPAPIKGKEPAVPSSWSASSQPFPYKRRRPLSQSTLARPPNTLPTLPTSRSLGTIEVPANHRRSNTWTSSSGELGLLSEAEGVDGREEFVEEYNRLAKRYGIRPLVPGDFPIEATNTFKSVPTRKGSWFSKAKQRTSSGQSTQTVIIKADQQQHRRRRSISDAALNLIHHAKKDGLKDENLQALVRLCGKSLFYLPSEYAPCSLVLPTCFRALAQALVQQADMRGIFRVPGSIRVVDMLYDYYCADRDTDDVSTTTRCPNLPTHIKYSVHDVASAFKKFLAGLPGGILGSLSLFDALVAIHSQLHTDPELTKTRETKLRARLIALVIGTVKSQYQRELICAVFGLLCFIGRAAENTPREDEDGRPLPTADLMGYNALSIVFGPLLINDLIDSYKMKVADPASGLVLLPVSKSRKGKGKHKRKKSKAKADDSTSVFTVDKINIANSIAEMLIIHWREVVRQMRSLGTLKIKRNENASQHKRGRAKLASSASASLLSRKPPGWDEPGQSYQFQDRSISPTTISPTPTPKNSFLRSQDKLDELEPLSIKRRRSRPSNSSTPYRVPIRALGRCLSPTVEESPLTKQKARSVDQISHPGTVSTQHTLLRHSLGNSPKRTFGRLLTDSDRETEKTLNYTELGRNREGSPRANMRENLSMIHHNPLGHILSGTARSPLSPRGSPNSRFGEYFDTQGNDPSPADKWKALTLASRASTESLAKAAKERRLRRSPGNLSYRQSKESLIQRGERPTTPEWKRRLGNDRSGERQRPARLSPDKKSIFEEPPQSERKSIHLSPEKSAFDGRSRPTSQRSQRSSSKPMEGAVKAMTALFDNAVKEPPASPSVSLVGKTKRTPKESSSLLSPYLRSNSPIKFTRSESSPTVSTPSKSGFEQVETPTRKRKSESAIKRGNHVPVFSEAVPETSSTKVPHVPLRPTSTTFSASRKVPVVSPAGRVPLRDRELSRPPSLGTMVPHLDEPPVAQHLSFIRPSLSPLTAHGESDDERMSTRSLRPASSNSILHTQIRRLQRQLELRTEESTQLRRQLEARENMDIGKLCEQLREAKRECKIWRERAEAAEKRVAVFKQFTARVRGLRDTATLDDLASSGQVDGSSHYSNGRMTLGGSVSSFCSEHTENQEDLKDRIRRDLKRRAAASADDQTLSGSRGLLRGDAGIMRGRQRKMMPDERTAQLWDIAEELLTLDDNLESEAE
ncbi:hypothetical protein F5Y04DRAFT_283842 [Hypomontagnella monticulosa]|nr:hypothetical protein F5Y04DRAFT_283842 [Hypomontagnella monticulosa]